MPSGPHYVRMGPQQLRTAREHRPGPTLSENGSQRYADGEQLAAELLRALPWQLAAEKGVDLAGLGIEQIAQVLDVVAVAHQTCIQGVDVGVPRYSAIARMAANAVG
jgi:hypothetical protein